MAGECVCHVNGYQVKDATARNELSKIKTDVRLAREDAKEARRLSLQNQGEVESARKEAAQAATSAKTAFNTANAALPKTGGTMEGSVNMGGKALTNAVNLGGQVLFLENKTGGGEVTAEANTAPGVVNFQHWKKPAACDVILRGIANPTNDNDAASKAYVDSITGPDMVIKIYGSDVTVVRGSYAAVADKLRNAIPPVVNVVQMSYEQIAPDDVSYTATTVNVESVTLFDNEKEPHLDICIYDGGTDIYIFEDGSIEM